MTQDYSVVPHYKASIILQWLSSTGGVMVKTCSEGYRPVLILSFFQVPRSEGGSLLLLPNELPQTPYFINS